MKKMTEEWALLWVQCLFQNMDYCSYCVHNDADDEQEEIAELDRLFPKLAEIHKDFGDEQGWPVKGTEDIRWRKWFDEHRSLFLPDVKVLNDPLLANLKNNEIILQIPLQHTLEETLYAVEEFLKTGCLFGSATNVLVPKYQLNMKNGRPAVGYEQVRQAVITSTDKVLDEKFMKKEKYNVKEATISFLQRNIDILGWSLDPRAKDNLMVKGLLSEERYESFKTMINRSRKDFKLLSANTVRGSFPDLSPFESSSWDAFKGKSSKPSISD
jgi:hypothetical protein